MKTVEEMLEDLRVATQEMIIVPNSWLPEAFHDNVRGGRTLARLNEMCEDFTDVDSEHVKLKALKARNIERLRKQVEEKSLFASHGDFTDLDGELDYSDNETNELQLHKNQMAMVSGMVSGGMIDSEDLEEE